MISSWICVFFILAGAFFMLIAAAGIVRFPDLYTRMHASTKAPSLGMLLLVIAVSIHFGSLAVILKSVFVVFIVFFTTPLTTHMISSAAHLLGNSKYDEGMRDDLQKEKEKQ